MNRVGDEPPTFVNKKNVVLVHDVPEAHMRVG